MDEVLSLPGMEGALEPWEEARIKSAQARAIFEASEGAVPWLDEYWELLAEGWSWRQAVYMIWAALPKDARKPSTQEALATELLGLSSDRQIRTWRENPALDARVTKLVTRALAHARPAIYEALIDAASNSNPRAHADRKLALEMLGDYVPKQKVTVGTELPDELREIGVDELRTIAASPGGDDE